MAVSFTNRLRATDSVLIQEIQGEIMFLNMASESYFGLDEVGSHMFRVLNAAESIQSAYSTLLREYEVDGDRLRTDLEDLIAKLLENGLIRIDDS